ncbi:unnamed protein product [Rotaria socialis]
MSKTNNLLTKYFKRDKKKVINESTTELTTAADEPNEDGGGSCSPKRLKLDKNNDLSILICSAAAAAPGPLTSPTSTRSTTPGPITSPTSTRSTTLGPLTSPTSTSSTTPGLLTSPTSTSSTTPTSLASHSERDPSHGSAVAKKFIFAGPYQPDLKFPTVDHRHFCRQWYSIYSWLEYSKIKDRAFCFICRLSYGTGKTDDWFSLTDKQHAKQAAENRAYLVEIIRTIVFLCKQGLAFRGHREHGQSFNKGDFLELLALRSLDNPLIKKNLNTLKFTDHKIQNEIIELLQQKILTKILNECRRAKYYSVMNDETTDISCHEQVSSVIRYVDDKLNVFEKFVGFERTASMTGEALCALLIKWLSKLDLKLENLVGQCYDGGSNMRGEYQGVSARLRQVASLGIYVHCNGHILNLCLIDVSARVPSVRNNFGVVSSLYNLIEGSAKRQQVFENIQKEAGLQALTVKQLCETRWTCRFECLKVILLRFNEIVTTLEVTAISDGFLLLNSLQSFDFIIHLFIMSEIYLLTNVLSKSLHYSNISLTDALVQVKITVDTLKSLRNEPEFERFYSEAMKLCDSNDIVPPKEIRKKKVPARFGGGVDAPAALNVKDHYRINIYYTILDTIIPAINGKFDENVLDIVILMEKLFLNKELLNDNEIQELSQHYSISYDDLKVEQRLYKAKMNDQKMNLSQATKFILENNFHIAF